MIHYLLVGLLCLFILLLLFLMVVSIMIDITQERVKKQAAKDRQEEWERKRKEYNSQFYINSLR